MCQWEAKAASNLVLGANEQDEMSRHQVPLNLSTIYKHSATESGIAYYFASMIYASDQV